MMMETETRSVEPSETEERPRTPPPYTASTTTDESAPEPIVVVSDEDERTPRTHPDRPEQTSSETLNDWYSRIHVPDNDDDEHALERQRCTLYSCFDSFLVVFKIGKIPYSFVMAAVFLITMITIKGRYLCGEINTYYSSTSIFIMILLFVQGLVYWISMAHHLNASGDLRTWSTRRLQLAFTIAWINLTIILTSIYFSTRDAGCLLPPDPSTGMAPMKPPLEGEALDVLQIQNNIYLFLFAYTAVTECVPFTTLILWSIVAFIRVTNYFKCVFDKTRQTQAQQPPASTATEECPPPYTGELQPYVI